jgi:hypothetical protein
MFRPCTRLHRVAESGHQLRSGAHSFRFEQDLHWSCPGYWKCGMALLEAGANQIAANGRDMQNVA